VARPPMSMGPLVVALLSRLLHWTISICYYPPDKETSMTMENERRLLAVHLKHLRLPTILAEYEKLAQEATQEDAPYCQYLRRLVELDEHRMAEGAI